MKFKNAFSLPSLTTVIAHTKDSVNWGKDTSCVYYLTLDETKRPYKYVARDYRGCKVYQGGSPRDNFCGIS